MPSIPSNDPIRRASDATVMPQRCCQYFPHVCTVRVVLAHSRSGQLELQEVRLLVQAVAPRTSASGSNRQAIGQRLFAQCRPC